MSDVNNPVAAVNPDPMATADNLFVSASEAQGGQAVTEGASHGAAMTDVSALQDMKFVLRADHKDIEVTGAELVQAAQKGLGFDTLTTKHGQLKQELQGPANDWKAFQEGMLANPGTTLQTYAKNYELLVGQVNKDGYFEAVDMTQSPNTPNTSQNSSPEVQALNTEVIELKDLVQQLVGGIASTEEEQMLMQQHDATADEVKQAQKVAADRNLPPGSLDIALAMVRQGVPRVLTETATAVLTKPQDELTNAEAILQMLKAGNPQFAGSGAAGGGPAGGIPYADMTPHQRTQRAWEMSKKEAGIASVHTAT